MLLKPMWATCLNESGVGEEIISVETLVDGGEDEGSLDFSLLLDLMLRLRERLLGDLAMTETS